MAKLSSEQLLALVPPSGWEWVKRPTLKTVGQLRRTGPYGVSDVPQVLKSLKAWALKNSIGLVGCTTTTITSGDGYRGYNHVVYNGFGAKANATASTIRAQLDGNSLCQDCYTEVPLGTLICERCRYPCACPACARSGHRVQQLPSTKEELATLGRKKPRQPYGCAGCFKVCTTSGCSNLVHPQSASTKCRLCDPTRVCSTCMVEHPIANTVCVGQNADGVDNRWACKKCFDRFSCPKCKRFEPGIDLVPGRNLCVVCVDAEDDAKRVKDEVFPKEELPISGDLRILSLPERPFRTVSIETEINGDGPYLARLLFRCGLIERPRVESYGAHAHVESRYPAFLKHDSSVTGGELITFLLNLDDKDHANVLLEILRKLRGMEKMSKVEYGANCGGHIHIDAHNYTYSDGWRLNSLFGYLEDPIFRLAGAGSKYGHRSQDPDHQRRAAAHPEGGYSKPVIKGPFGEQSVFGLKIEQTGRGHALNFRPFFQARELCTCGDIKYQTGANCRCNLGKATIEWRVWNSTGNPRILHAWIAFMQALHAYSQQGNNMTKEEEALYPDLSWNVEKWENLSEPFHDKQKERLEWIFTHLPLTPAERDSLVYALKQSDFKHFGETYLDGLLKLEGDNVLAAKKPARNPNRRQRKLTIKAPEPGDVPMDLPLVPPARRRVSSTTTARILQEQREAMLRAR